MTTDPLYPIVCAAMRHRTNGRIICGPRYYDPIMRAQIEASEGRDSWIGCEQGFVNSRGQFLTREEALLVALALGQRKHRCGGDETQLFSENLY